MLCKDVVFTPEAPVLHARAWQTMIICDCTDALPVLIFKNALHPEFLCVVVVFHSHILLLPLPSSGAEEHFVLPKWGADHFDMVNKKALTLFATTPEIAVIDGLTIQAGATYALQDAGYIDADDKEINAFGVSAKVAYASDILSASVATDMGYDALAEEFGADIAANLSFDFVGVDFYYATEAANSGVDGGKISVVTPDGVKLESDYKDGAKVENLLSLQAVLDLTAFNAPVKLTLTGKDLVNTQDLSATVDLVFGAFTVSPTVGYVVDTETFKAGVAAEYACDYFTAKAETNISTAFEDDDLVWDATASIENTTLIPGATIKLAWTDAEDLLKHDADADNEYGKIMASVKIDF